MYIREREREREKFVNNHNLLTKILYERRVLFIFLVKLNTYIRTRKETGRKPYYKNIRSGGNPFTMQ